MTYFRCPICHRVSQSAHAMHSHFINHLLSEERHTETDFTEFCAVLTTAMNEEWEGWMAERGCHNLLQRLAPRRLT